jgi:ATP-binding cassette subfamily B protein
MEKAKVLTTRERITAISRVAAITFKAAPTAVFVEVAGAIINAVLPIITTFFAALTTTALAQAFSGDHTAGSRAILYVIITASLGIVMTAWSSLQQYITKSMRYRVEVAVSDRMYEHFLRLDFWRYDDKKTIDTYDKAQRFANFFPYVFDRLATVASQFITLIAGLIALILVSWWLGLILVAAVIPGIVIQFRLSRAQTRHWNTNVETRRSRSMIEWNLLQPDHMAELRLYGTIRYLLDLRMKLRDLDEKQQIEFERKYILKRLGANALEAGAEVVALLWTVTQIINQALPIGQFIYVQQIVSRALGGSSGFVSALSSVDEDLANLVDYQEFMQLPEAVGNGKSFRGVPESIQLDKVSFHYPQSKTAVLKDVTLEIKRNQRVAIVGENGAGKTTLIKLLTGLYHPTKGAILLDNVALSDFEINSWHKHLAVLSQAYTAYGFANARDNVYFGDVSKPFDQERFDKALDLAEARTFLEKLPRGVDNYILNWMEDDEGNKGVDLSGGQWQRLALARNFYRNSSIIILDEPTSAIDALAESRIFQHLFEAKDKTIITISHRLTTVKKADVIFMLEDGKLVEQGTHAELAANKGAYFKMFESQL